MRKLFRTGSNHLMRWPGGLFGRRFLHNYPLALLLSLSVAVCVIVGVSIGREELYLVCQIKAD